MTGRTLALYGDTGSGKTTQAYLLAKYHARQGKRSHLVSSDRGGVGDFALLKKIGFADISVLGQGEDPWTFIDDHTSGKKLAGDIGLVVFDSATSIGESILDYITKDSRKIGQQNTQRFTVGGGLQIGLNNESHYGLVQGFIRDQLWKSTWLTEKGIDVLWTFAMLRGEKQDDTPVLGPMVAGKALTPAIPKWFRYTFRLVSVPTTQGSAPRHLLYLQEQPDFGGTGMSFGNARYPIDAITPLPAVIEPASIIEAMELIEKAEAEAEEVLRRELLT